MTIVTFCKIKYRKIINNIVFVIITRTLIDIKSKNALKYNNMHDRHNLCIQYNNMYWYRRPLIENQDFTSQCCYREYNESQKFVFAYFQLFLN